MKHKHIQKRLLLYLDVELPEREMNKIRAHLSGCSSCYRQSTLLESMWKLDSVAPKELPPPFLWTRLENRIKGNTERPRPIRNWSASFRPLAVRIVAVLAAILLGVYLGSPTKSSWSSETLSQSQSKAFAHEFRLDLFDMVPSGTPGSALIGRIDTER
ncbi:MAG TPA: anti-sigma factor [Candidatus Kryptobacter bacterium]|nr:anti-sigma factor [Candidatus Kryptobacter bacterium]